MEKAIKVKFLRKQLRRIVPKSRYIFSRSLSSYIFRCICTSPRFYIFREIKKLEEKKNLPNEVDERSETSQTLLFSSFFPFLIFFPLLDMKNPILGKESRYLRARRSRNPMMRPRLADSGSL